MFFLDAVLLTIIGGLAAAFLLVFLKYKKMVKTFKATEKELEEAKTVLEIKVQARTKELKDLAEGLEDQVKERTKELRERINDLERFHKLTVGRELKMVELKEEIKKLKKEIGIKKGRT